MGALQLLVEHLPVRRRVRRLCLLLSAQLLGALLGDDDALREGVAVGAEAARRHEHLGAHGAELLGLLGMQGRGGFEGGMQSRREGFPLRAHLQGRTCRGRVRRRAGPGARGKKGEAKGACDGGAPPTPAHREKLRAEARSL